MSIRRKQRQKMSKRERRYLKKHFLTDHHILPKSLGGGRMDNIAQVSDDKHKKYHHLFENKSPDEILDYLVRYFWNGQKHWVEDYLKGER
jgi:hypothetical protein